MREVFLGDGASEGRSRAARVGVKAFWIDRNHPGQGVFHFEGCASISEAEKFRGLDVLIPFEQRVDAACGEIFRVGFGWLFGV